MNNSGIISQYGFLFQRKVFALYVLENIAAKQHFCYEGRDDIEIANSEKICAIYDIPSKCVQVKSGHVNEKCFDKVVANWLLLDGVQKDTFVLYVENKLDFEWILEDLINSVKKYVIDGKKKKITAIARMTYDMYSQDIESNESKKLLHDIETVISTMKIVHCEIEELDKKIEDSFIRNYCSDINEYELAKKKRVERFMQYLNQHIDEAIGKRVTYTLVFPEFMKMIIQVSDEINDRRYVPDVKILKKNFQEKARKIVEEKKKREVQQLFLVDKRDAFVVEGIVQELLYKDFREVFVESKITEISNIEEFAKDNYNEIIFNEEQIMSPREIYNKTVEMPIDSFLLPNGKVYRKGCYIYLTGEEIDEENQITWGIENETE